ncbi:MAG: amidohydrolase family protein [Actinobacteria bacterium]|nr:amidohydrolase family protein [Actinomycetota bacterium]
MSGTMAEKIDGYAHISPPRYTASLQKEFPGFYNQILGFTPPLFDMRARFEVMDAFGSVAQVLTVGPVPPLEVFAPPERAVSLAKLANDEMAELVDEYPERFAAAIALLPMNDVEAALQEADRAIKELGFKGVYVHSNINGKPLDAPEFLPLFEKMAAFDLPVYIHPWRGNDYPEYPTEKESKYAISSTFGWPYETTAAMTRLVFTGYFERFPELKVVTHHCGGMVSFYAERIAQHYSQMGISYHDYADISRVLTKAPLEYYKMFYNDTAIHGNTPALMLAYSLWGADHIFFAADMPLGDPEFGKNSYTKTIAAIEAMGITDAEKDQIFAGNVRRLLRLGD